MTPEQRDARREEIALQLFAAMLTRPDSQVSIGDLLAEQQIRTAFEMASTFLVVADMRRRAPAKRDELPDPQPIIKA